MAPVSYPGTTFRSPDEVFHADSCEPLRAAARKGEVRLEALARGSYPGRPMGAKTLPEVLSVGYWDAPTKQDWGLDWHRNEGIEITYLSRGKIGFAVDEQTYALHKGQVTITRPWQVHRVGSPNVGASRLHWLILDVGVRRPHQNWHWPPWLVCTEENLRALTTLLQHNEQPVWQGNEELGKCFAKLASAVTERTLETRESRLKLHINELLIVLLELLQNQQIPLDATLTSSRRTVEMFLSALPRQLELAWDLTAMARECALGRSQFTYYCRQLTQMSPKAYLNFCRVSAAASLLESQPALTVTEIANRCGFESSQYFATVFRGATGYAPRAFRDLSLARAEFVPRQYENLLSHTVSRNVRGVHVAENG